MVIQIRSLDQFFSRGQFAVCRFSTIQRVQSVKQNSYNQTELIQFLFLVNRTDWVPNECFDALFCPLAPPQIVADALDQVGSPATTCSAWQNLWFLPLSTYDRSQKLRLRWPRRWTMASSCLLVGKMATTAAARMRKVKGNDIESMPFFSRSHCETCMW